MEEGTLLEYESNNKLLVERDVGFGFLVYNTFHEKRNVCITSNDIDVIREKLWRGWKHYPGINKWILQAPEITLSDLSEPYNNPVLNTKGIYVYHYVLQRIDLEKEIEGIIKDNDKFDGLSIVMLSGKYNNVEHRIAVSDLRGKKIPYLLYERVKTKYEEEFKDVIDSLDEQKLNALERELDIKRIEAERGSVQTQSIYNLLIGLYTRLGIDLDTREHGWIISGIWDAVPAADVYIFVPKSGIKFGLGFIEDRQTIDNIMFWEYHIGMDMMKDVIFLKKELERKEVLIIDKSYSGKTLTYLKHQVNTCGGNARTVAMFPKSVEGIRNMDFVVFLDRFLTIDEVPTGKEWYEGLFWKSVNKKKNPTKDDGAERI